MKRFSKLSIIQRINILGKVPENTLQGIGFFLILIATSFFFAQGIINNNIRIIICAFLALVLGVFCLKIETGAIAILIYLPFMALIRRWIYLFNPYVKFDPILILSSALTVFMFGYIFIFYGDKILKQTKNNKLLRYMTYLLILFILEVFNPFQGGLAVGFSGIMYYIIPLLWFYFGFFVPQKRIPAIFYIIVIIGIITAFYGLHQLYHGFLPFEKYWIKYGGPSSLLVKGFIKPFSTFTNPQEYAGYVLLAGAIVFMYLFKKPLLYPLWIGSFLVLMYGMFMTSSRMEIFFFFILVSIFLALRLGNWKKALLANIIFLSIIFFGISKINPPSSMIAAGSAKEAHLEHLITGVKHPTAKGSTFWVRVDMTKWVFNDLKYYWFGRGLGATTRGTAKFGGKSAAGAEIFQYAISGSCGFPGIILYFLIMYWVIKSSIFLVKKDLNIYWIPATLAIWLTFALDPRLYSIGPFVYLLWGWIAKEYSRYEKEN
ncbi:hypothetical protein KAW65_03780 [candidate division WOR-3 bacterium]|nr:hypothetical protein [candidate division WOR-3 bacterium]